MHTPGPWKLSFSDYGNEHWFGGKGEGQFVIRGNCDLDDTEGDIACGGLHREDTPSKASECEANARLIAAAPKLLEALEDMVEKAMPSCSHEHCKARNEQFVNARAVIAEAKS